MTYTITNQCIGCQRCLSDCPTGAIQTNGSMFWIDIHRCNQCESTHGVPQCWAVCPTNEGCVPLSTGTVAVTLTPGLDTSTDYWQTWFATYSRMVTRLKASKRSGYWQQWFDSYAKILQNLQAQAGHNANMPVMS